jgi:hypothetical protein
VWFGAGDRLVEHARRAQRGGPAVVGLVERLGGVDAPHLGFLFGVFGRVRLLRQRFPEFDQERLQVRARVRVERVEHLVELHRIGGLRDRDRRA